MIFGKLWRAFKAQINKVVAQVTAEATVQNLLLSGAEAYIEMLAQIYLLDLARGARVLHAPLLGIAHGRSTGAHGHGPGRGGDDLAGRVHGGLQPLRHALLA